MPCRLCVADPHPKEFKTPRKCAFESEFFNSDNWNCATLNLLRAGKDNESYSADQTLKVIPHSGTFLLLGFYKGRGRTEVVAVLDEQVIGSASLHVCETIIAKKG